MPASYTYSKPNNPHLTNINDLNDIEISSIIDGQVLKYRSIDDKWINSNFPDTDWSGYITKEIPTGDINGINIIFNLSDTPIINSENIFLNGLLLNNGDYTILGNIITFVEPPIPGDEILVNYINS